MPFKLCRHGTFMYPDNDTYIGKSLELYGEYSEGEIELFQKIVTPQSVVIEAGSNIGTHSVPLSKITKNIILIEAQTDIFDILECNLNYNNLTRMTRNKALGATPGKRAYPIIPITAKENFGGVSMLSSMYRSDMANIVDVITLDSFGLNKLDLLKIDVEGMEKEVLDGGTLTILHCRPIIYVENDREDKSEELVQKIRQLGYRLFWHCPPLYRPNNFFNNPENVFGNIVSVNMLCIPTETDRFDLTGGLQEVIRPKFSEAWLS
jgi:FkbM family methyltransferase